MSPGVKQNFRGNCKIIQSYWERARTACTGGGSSMEFSPALYFLTLQGSGSPCFPKPRRAQDRHLIPPSEGGLYALLVHATIKLSVHLCYKHQTCWIQSPGLLAATHGCLAVVRGYLHCTVWGPCTVNVVLITLPERIPQFVSLHQFPPTVRKVLMPSGLSDSKNCKVTQNQALNCFSKI